MDPKIKQKALRLLTNGMYILTTRAGERFAASTVTWASQASFKPPLIMAAIRKESTVLGCMKESRVAAFHILGHNQQKIAQKFFATAKTGDGTLNDEPYVEGKNSAPILKSLPAHLECSVVDIRDEYGDHAIVVLEVVDAQVDEQPKPLTVSDCPWQYAG